MQVLHFNNADPEKNDTVSKFWRPGAEAQDVKESCYKWHITAHQMYFSYMIFKRSHNLF